MSDEKRHVLILQSRPDANKGTRGQPASDFETESNSGNDAEYYGSIKTLSGRELEVARQSLSTARARIRVFADSRFTISAKKRFKEKNGTRFFYIGFVSTVDELGHEVECLCGYESQ